MKRTRTGRKVVIILLIVCLATPTLQAQLTERICQTDYEINPDKAGELFIEVDNISFFKDNEFTGPVMKGYTLPGFWLQPKGIFFPLKNIKLELGLHALVYSGAYKYPNYGYQDIAQWKGNQFQRGSHILPYFRAQLKLSNLNLVWGNLYGGSNHNLIAPLYNPELNLTADPEMGFQLLYDIRPLHIDAWINWQSFIFRQDTHQEAFTVGLSSQVKFNTPASHTHFYMPVQMTIQHRGGEIDTLYTNSVQTLMNGSIGAGVTWNPNRKYLRQVNLEANVLGYYQQNGKLWPLGKGYACYIEARANITDDFRIEGGYFLGKDFISLFGIPYFGTVSTSNKDVTFDGMQTWHASVEYSRKFKQHYAMGVKADLYYSCPGKSKHPINGVADAANATNFSVGIYLRINPSFLIYPKKCKTK